MASNLAHLSVVPEKLSANGPHVRRYTPGKTCPDRVQGPYSCMSSTEK